MSNAIQIIIAFLLVAAVFILSRYFMAWMMQRAAKRIILDLRNKGAVDVTSAVVLPYAKRELLRIGLRDYRPKALVGLVNAGVVGHTEDGRFFLLSHGALTALVNE